MSYAIPTQPIGTLSEKLTNPLRGISTSFLWAMEMRRRCNRETAAGRQLDGDAIRRIADEISARTPDQN